MRLPRGLAMLLALAGAAAPAHATTVKTGKPAASQPPALAWATRAQLRDCMDTEDSLKQRSAAIEGDDAAHARRFDEIAAEGTRLSETQARLDGDDTAAVNAFNQQVQAHNDHVKALNEQAGQSQPVVQALQADMAAYNRQCATLAYRPEDLDALTLERKRRAASAP